MGYLKDLFGQLADIMYKVGTFDFGAAVEAVKNFKMPEMDKIRAGLADEAKTKKADEKLAQLQSEYDALSGKDGKDIDQKRADIMSAMEATRQGSTKGIQVAAVSSKIKPGDGGFGTSEGKALGNSGGSSIKNITQKIDIKNVLIQT